MDLGAIAGAGATAFLTFDYATTGDLEEGGVDVVVVEASSDGVGFTVLETFDGDVAGSRVYDISAFVSADTTVRFRILQAVEAPESALIVTT